MRLHDVSKGAGGDNISVLSETELKKLQKILLMILDDMNSICQENKLNFILIGGSAIGAMRHKGFIPWDDDVDIAMTRHDYEKLAQLIREKYSDKYTVSDAKDQVNYGRIIPKIRLKNTAYRTVLEKDLEDCGIRLDIFIIENVYGNVIARNLQGVVSLFFGFALSCRRLYNGRKEFSKLSNSMSFKGKMIFGFLFSFASLETWARWTDYWYSICKNDFSKWVSVPTDGAHFFGELTKRENLCNHKQVEFEGRQFYVPASVDAYLTRIYGNYMQIPPEDKRVRSCYLEYDLGMYDEV